MPVTTQRSQSEIDGSNFADLLELLRGAALPISVHNSFKRDSREATSPKLSFSALADLVEQLGTTLPMWLELRKIVPPDVLSLLQTASTGTTHGHEIPSHRIFSDDEVFRRLRRDNRDEATDICLERYAIPNRLPVVQQLLERFPPNSSLHSVVVIACQHLMGSVFAQMEHLRRLGVEPENCFILGKPYTSSRLVYEKFMRAGYHVAYESIEFPNSVILSSLQYEQFMRRTLQRLVHLAIRQASEIRKNPRLLAIDDGGLLIEVLDEVTRRPHTLPLDLKAIEQTRGGI